MVFISCCVVMVVSLTQQYYGDNGDADGVAMDFVQLNASFNAISYLGG